MTLALELPPLGLRLRLDFQGARGQRVQNTTPVAKRCAQGMRAASPGLLAAVTYA